MTASATILWDSQTEEGNEVVLVDELVASNSSDANEEFYTSERNYDAMLIHYINFPNNCNVPSGTEIQLTPRERLGGNTGPITLVYGSQESYTETEKVPLKMPDTVAPNTKVTVRVTRRETYTSAPVEITAGDVKETATYMCQSYSDIKAETSTESL